MANPLDSKENQEGKSKSFLSGMKADGSGSSSYIGKNIQFRGELIGAEDLHVEGVVDGTVSMGGQNLSIGQGGLVSANIHAQTVLVNGTLQGDVFADDLIEICKTARVQGNLIAPRIKLADGGKFKGTIDMIVGEQGKQDRFNEFKQKLLSSEVLSAEMVNALPSADSDIDLLAGLSEEETEELLDETT